MSGTRASHVTPSLLKEGVAGPMLAPQRALPGTSDQLFRPSNLHPGGADSPLPAPRSSDSGQLRARRSGRPRAAPEKGGLRGGRAWLCASPSPRPRPPRRARPVPRSSRCGARGAADPGRTDPLTPPRPGTGPPVWAPVSRSWSGSCPRWRRPGHSAAGCCPGGAVSEAPAAQPCVGTSTEPLSTSAQQGVSPGPRSRLPQSGGGNPDLRPPWGRARAGGAHRGEHSASPRQSRGSLSPKPACGAPALSGVSLPLDLPWSPGSGEPLSTRRDGPSSQPPAPRQDEPLRAGDTVSHGQHEPLLAGLDMRSGRSLAVSSVLDFSLLLSQFRRAARTRPGASQSPARTPTPL